MNDMSYCTYHPLAPATFSCAFCHTQSCDSCVDEGERNTEPVCFACNRTVDFLGAVNQATPFWRRLEESFRYPLKPHSLILIITVSLLGSLLTYAPLGILWYLMLSGAFLKYSFSCLEQTARGLLVPPDISEAYSGGMALLGNLLIMLLVAGFAVFGAYRYLGPQIAGLLTFLIIVALPAIIIMYGMTESLVEALNPLNLLRLITAVGLPYGLLLAFILIMSASVGVVSQLIGYEYSLLSNALQSIVSNYYTVVMFHIMGYMIFQYQGELGFTAGEDFGEAKPPRPARDRLAAKISIKLKEGDYNEVVALFASALKKFPGDKEFNRQNFEFFYATGRGLESAASRYLGYLIRSGQEHQLVLIYKRVRQLQPNFRPDTAATRHQLAIACKESGDSLSAAKLLNGLHREFPKYARLVEAYELMANALDDVPHQGEAAKKCRELVQRLAERSAPPATPTQRKSITAQPTGELAFGSDAVPVRETADGTIKEAQALAPIDFK